MMETADGASYMKLRRLTYMSLVAYIWFEFIFHSFYYNYEITMPNTEFVVETNEVICIIIYVNWTSRNRTVKIKYIYVLLDESVTVCML